MYRHTPLRPLYGVSIMIKELKQAYEGRGEVKGWSFFQLEQSENAYLYKKSKQGRLSYEVFKKRINTRFGIVSYPTSKSFGQWAWEFKSYEDALRKYEAIK